MENNNHCVDASNTERDFTLVQTVYGIALVLGLENVAESIFLYLLKPIYTDENFHADCGIVIGRYVAVRELQTS